MDRRKQQQQRNPGGGGKGGKAGACGKKPIKVVYISNPMRVRTNAAGFRALVQELTGRHADPSKYRAQHDDEDAAAAARPLQEQLSPDGSAAESTPHAAAATGPAAWPDFAAAAAFGHDEDDVFRSQLLDNDGYSVVFSPPPTLLYDYHQHGKV